MGRSSFASDDSVYGLKDTSVFFCINAYVQYNIAFERNPACYQDNKLLPYLKESAAEERQITILTEEAAAMDRSVDARSSLPDNDNAVSTSVASEAQIILPIDSNVSIGIQNTNRNATETKITQAPVKGSGSSSNKNRNSKKKTRKQFFFLI